MHSLTLKPDEAIIKLFRQGSREVIHPGTCTGQRPGLHLSLESLIKHKIRPTKLIASLNTFHIERICITEEL